MGVGVFGLQRSPSLRSQARMQWLNHRFAKGCLALVGGIVKHAANGGTIPDRFAGSCPFLSCFQTATNLSNGTPISSDPLKDLANHSGLFPLNLKAGLSRAFLFGDIAIPVGSTPQHTHLPDLCSMPLATPAPL